MQHPTKFQGSRLDRIGYAVKIFLSPIRLYTNLVTMRTHLRGSENESKTQGNINNIGLTTEFVICNSSPAYNDENFLTDHNMKVVTGEPFESSDCVVVCVAAAMVFVRLGYLFYFCCPGWLGVIQVLDLLVGILTLFLMPLKGLEETKWVGEKAKEIDSLGFKLWYSGTITCVQTQGGLTKYFPILVGLHQGSALSPYLFALGMDVLTRHLQEDVPWCMLFADDILLVDKTREGVEGLLNLPLISLLPAWLFSWIMDKATLLLAVFRYSCRLSWLLDKVTLLAVVLRYLFGPDQVFLQVFLDFGQSHSSCCCVQLFKQ
ncbi:hypothetical protein KFK09_017747 [Dendrobium nobile]|uniref:Reverse transcriptase domain-containing protein n=1 Tax=Dendrobium nobile TaxID=94219 RepID=A0A8T3ASW2_DENNO|nr:hypothetical protein KFK09_017747 [Dendrobium nobile]